MNLQDIIALNNKRELINEPMTNPNLFAFTRKSDNTRLDIIRNNIYNPNIIVDESYQTEENRLNNFIQNNIDFKNSITNGNFNLNSTFEGDAMRYTSLGSSFNGELYKKIAESKTGASNFQTVTSDGMKNVIAGNRAAEMFRNDQITPHSQLASEIARNLLLQLQQTQNKSSSNPFTRLDP